MVPLHSHLPPCCSLITPLGSSKRCIWSCTVNYSTESIQVTNKPFLGNLKLWSFQLSPFQADLQQRPVSTQAGREKHQEKAVGVATPEPVLIQMPTCWEAMPQSVRQTFSTGLDRQRKAKPASLPSTDQWSDWWDNSEWSWLDFCSSIFQK